MLVLTAFTAVQRFVKVWRQASAERPAREPSRWQARRVARPHREARGSGPSAATTPSPDHPLPDGQAVVAAYKAGAKLSQVLPDSFVAPAVAARGRRLRPGDARPA